MPEECRLLASAVGQPIHLHKKAVVGEIERLYLGPAASLPPLSPLNLGAVNVEIESCPNGAPDRTACSAATGRAAFSTSFQSHGCGIVKSRLGQFTSAMHARGTCLYAGLHPALASTTLLKLHHCQVRLKLSKMSDTSCRSMTWQVSQPVSSNG